MPREMMLCKADLARVLSLPWPDTADVDHRERCGFFITPADRSTNMEVDACYFII